MSSLQGSTDRSAVDNATGAHGAAGGEQGDPSSSSETLARLQAALDELTQAQRQMQRQYDHLRMIHQQVEFRLRQEIADASRDVERRVSERTRELEQAASAKDHFLAMLSHELRTPLMPALLLANALEQQVDLPAEVREDLSVIRRNLELEVALIDDLLDLTRIARGKLSLNLLHVRAHYLVWHVYSMLSAQITDKQLEVKVDLQAENDNILGDPTRIQQVLWNLLGNAIKFTPSRGTIEVTSRNTADGKLRISVSDTGIGIEPELLPQMFEVFRQGKEGMGNRVGGLGLGLAIGRLLAEMHGGILTAHSDGPGTGATFTLELPTADQPGEGETVGSEALGQPLQLLLVDDHEDTARALGSLLQRMGHSVQRAHTMDQAREQIASTAFDVVLCDLRLPDGNGLELIDELVKKRGIPTIALSGLGTRGDMARTREAGACMHLVKPITFDRVCAALAYATTLIKEERGEEAPPRHV